MGGSGKHGVQFLVKVLQRSLVALTSIGERQNETMMLAYINPVSSFVFQLLSWKCILPLYPMKKLYFGFAVACLMLH